MKICNYCRRPNDEIKETCSGCGAVLPEIPSLIRINTDFMKPEEIRKLWNVNPSYPFPSGSSCQFEE